MAVGMGSVGWRVRGWKTAPVRIMLGGSILSMSSRPLTLEALPEHRWNWTYVAKPLAWNNRHETSELKCF
jgi:hypothetical protein